MNVVKNYAGTYDDPAKGKECALALHDQGADVIFQIASATGDGVFEAAKENGFYAIGVDSGQADESGLTLRRKDFLPRFPWTGRGAFFGWRR